MPPHRGAPHARPAPRRRTSWVEASRHPAVRSRLPADTRSASRPTPSSRGVALTSDSPEVKYDHEAPTHGPTIPGTAAVGWCRGGRRCHAGPRVGSTHTPMRDEPTAGQTPHTAADATITKSPPPARPAAGPPPATTPATRRRPVGGAQPCGPTAGRPDSQDSQQRISLTTPRSSSGN